MCLIGDLESFLLEKSKAYVRHSVSYSPVMLQQSTSRAQNSVTSYPPTMNSQSTLVTLNIEIMFGAETSCASGTVSYRKM